MAGPFLRAACGKDIPNLTKGAFQKAPLGLANARNVPSIKARSRRVPVSASWNPANHGRAKPVTNVASTSSPSTAESDVSQVHPGTQVSVYDTTLRDGSQMVGISLSVADKLKIAEQLIRLGVEYIEGGWPGSNPRDAEFFHQWPQFFARQVQLQAQSQAQSQAQAPSAESPKSSGSTALQHRQVKLAAFGSTRYKNTTCDKDANVAALLACNAPVITLVAKAWDEQVHRVLETSLEENLAMIADTVAYFKERGREVMLDAEHFYDGFAANPEYALECARAAAAAGVDAVILCDTNGGTMPWVIEEVTAKVRAELHRGQLQGAWGSMRVGIHAHNDCGCAAANSVAAVRGGATVVQGCINGYGERTGNADLVTIIGILQVKLGMHCLPPDRLSHLSDVSSRVAQIAAQPSDPAQPFVGDNAFAHKGGIHVAALRKMPTSYNHCDPAVVGNAMRSVVSDLSGRGNILDKAERAGLQLDKEAAGRVLARVKQMEAEGCTFENASASVDLIIVRRRPGYIRPFQVLEFSVISSNRGGHPSSGATPSGASEPRLSEREFDWLDGGSCNSQAIVKVHAGGKDHMTAAEGNGPVDALSHALRLALQPLYPQLEVVELIDYRVRLLEPSGARPGTMSTTRVTIDFADHDGGKWTTVGAHSSIVEASFRALVDGMEFGIANCTEDGCRLNS